MKKDMKAFDRDEIAELVETAKRYRLTFVGVADGDRELEITLPAPELNAEADTPLTGEPVTMVEEKDLFVTSALVGFFREPAPVFIPGSRVEPDTVVGIVEALGLPNEITAGVSGMIEEILVSEGQPVEYGQPLARVRG